MKKGLTNEMWNVYLNEVNVIDELDALDRFFIDGDNHWLFRGMKNAQWDIKSSLERAEEDTAKVGIKLLNDVELCQKENSMIAKFKEMVRWNHYLGEDRMQYLAAMQHYGLPTRMVDFSEMFSVGLFFAVQKCYKKSEVDKNTKRIVWAVNKNCMKDMARLYEDVYHKTHGMSSDDDFQRDFFDSFFEERGMTSIKRGIIVTRLEGNNPRLIAQRGVFLVPYTPTSFMANFSDAMDCRVYGLQPVMSVQELCRKDDLSHLALIKIIFHDNLRDLVIKWLERRGRTSLSLFPDMEGIEMEIRRQFHYEEF